MSTLPNKNKKRKNEVEKLQCKNRERESVSEKLQQVWIRQLDLSYLTTMELGNIEPIETNGL